MARLALDQGAEIDERRRCAAALQEHAGCLDADAQAVHGGGAGVERLPHAPQRHAPRRMPLQVRAQAPRLQNHLRQHQRRLGVF